MNCHGPSSQWSSDESDVLWAVVDPLGFSRILQCDSLRLVLDLLFDLDGLFYSGNLNFNRWFCSDRSNFFGVGFAAEIERG